MTRILLLAIAIFVTALGPVAALELKGELIQGSMVVGKAAPGSSVSHDGRPVQVSASGDFVIGLERDAHRLSVLVVRGPDGTSVTRELSIARRDYAIQRIDGLPKGKVSPSKKSMKRILAEQELINAARRRATDEAWFAGAFTWPAQGRISGVYGSQRVLNGKPRRPHFGVDIAAPIGTPIVAAADGIVALVHEDMFFSGKTVILDHGHDVTTIYIHMSKIVAEPGQELRRGDPIGEIGATGRVTGPHLHWGLNVAGKFLDPQLLVGPMTEPLPEKLAQ